MHDTLNQDPHFQYPNQSFQPPIIPNPSLSSDPSFYHPPLSAFNPFSNSGFNPLNYPSIQAQPINYSDSNVHSSTWVVKQSAPIKYPPAIQALKKEAIASTSYDATPNYNLVGQRLVNRVPKKKQKPFKAIPKKLCVSQSVRCELCKIECNNVQVYEKHLSGKKHSKGLLNLYAPVLKAATVKTGPVGESASAASSKAADLEVKKQKLVEGGTAVQSLRICTICNVACNGEVAFSDHVTGKKHVAKERTLGSMANPNPISGSTQGTNGQSNPTKKRKNGDSTLASCDVCKISCTSNDGLQIHLLGKKHQKTMQKLQGIKTTEMKGTKAVEPKPPQVKKNESSDVKMMKQKILESGTVASALRTCTICNVVCNSETVLKSHLGGQKHAAMVKLSQAQKGGLQILYPAVSG